MQIVGIVAEYNPFHNGHAYQMEQARRKTDAEAVVVAMSGNYTQRGEFAVINKFARAEAAVRCGADLVLEIPLPFSVASAERFATGGVAILNEFCSVISCGCESEDVSLLMETAELLCSREVKENVFDLVKKGDSYAVATETVLRTYNNTCADLIRRPNNILACEYQKAIVNQASPMSLLPITRVGAQHNSERREGIYASASHIRSLSLEESAAYMPEESLHIISREAEAGRMITVNPEVSMLSYLRRLDPEGFSKIAGCREGLEYRICHALQRETTISGVIDRVTTKRYPSSRIRRILLSAYLDMTEDIMKVHPLPPYVRVLALNHTGRKILAEHRKSGGRPILTKGTHYVGLSPAAIRLFEKELMADDLYASAYPNETQRKSGLSLLQSPFVFKKEL